MRGLIAILAAFLVMGAAMAPSAVAQSPQEECAALGLEYVDKIDEIDGSGTYTSDEGIEYTVTVTPQGSGVDDQYTLSPDPTTQYPGYTDIIQAPKFGVGGGLSHITICGSTAAPTPTPTPTQELPTPTPTPTQELPTPTPTQTATATQTQTATATQTVTSTATTTTTATATQTATGTTTGTATGTATQTTTGTATATGTATKTIAALPSTGSGDGGSGGGIMAALLAAAGIVLAAGAYLTRRQVQRA